MSRGVVSFFRGPSPKDLARAHNDIDAIRAGRRREVTCFLRADFGPYPRRQRQGILVLTSTSAAWRPFWRLRRRPLSIAVRITSLRVRDAQPDEWNLKKGGTAFGVVTVPTFCVVVCKTLDGTIEFAVPALDAETVAAALRSASNASG
jgi:hypothetical protein